MKTEIVKCSYDASLALTPLLYKRVFQRNLSESDWIESKASSGTLKKSKLNGLNYKNHYLLERIQYEFGYPFEIKQESFINFNSIRSEADCHAITEFNWHFERYCERSLFKEDYFEAKWIKIDDSNGNVLRQGLGIIIRQTSAPFIPDGYLAFALLSTWDSVKKQFSEVLNPA